MYTSTGYSGYSSYSGFSSERDPPGIISLFEIMFSDRSNTYMEGQEVKGDVILDLLEDMVIESELDINL